MKKIAVCLALVMILCLCLAACRPAASGNGESTAENTTAGTDAQSPDETQGANTPVTLPDLNIPEQQEGDYHLPPETDPDLTVGDT